MKNNRWLPILFSVLIVSTLGCGFFSKAGDDELIFAATEVGAPQGEMINKNIGPAGGIISSPDGRITLVVPKGAVTEATLFSIQPITNKAAGGLGLAFRLGPDGKTFAVPLEIAIRYNERDLEGTVAEAFSAAFQDRDGKWHSMNAAKLDPAEKTLKFTTTHFTDVAFFTGLKLSPASATVRVKTSIPLELFVCQQQTMLEILLRREVSCSTASMNDSRLQGKLLAVNSVVGGDATFGTVELSGAGLKYTAPTRKPSPDTVSVEVVYNYERHGDWARGQIQKTIFSKIKIVDSGYAASGQDGPSTYSGTICSLDEPFVLTVNHPLYESSLRFTPINGTAGTAKYAGSAGAGLIKFNGSGPYTVEGLDTNNAYILWSLSSDAKSPVITTSGTGTAHIKLTPLETPECNPPPAPPPLG